MKRYLSIYWALIKINFSLLFTYRANLYNSILISLGWGIVSLSSIFLLTSQITHVYGWTREELYLLTGFYSIIVGISHMLFSSGFERFARTISLGKLDTYLLSPIDTQLYFSLKEFRPVSLLRVLLGIIFTSYIIGILHISFSVYMIVSSSILIFSGVLLLYSLWFLVVTFMIWNPNLSNLIDFLYNFNNLGRYPPSLIIYTKNIVLFLLIPFTLIGSVPARFILGKATLLELSGLVGCSVGLFILSRYFWKFALRFYTSASS